MESNPEKTETIRDYPIEPLLSQDVVTLHVLAEGVFHNPKRFDHQGSWRTCGDCFADARWGAYALAHRQKDGSTPLSTRQEKLDWVTANRTRVTSVLKDGRDYERAARGVDASPAAATKAAGIRSELSEAVEAGRLHTTVEIAALVLQYALAFFSDPGERPEQGHLIPVRRIANTLSSELGRDLTPEDVAAIWAQIDALDAPKIRRKIAQQGSQHLCGHLSQVVGHGGASTSLVELTEQSFFEDPSERSEHADAADALRLRAVAVVVAEAVARGLSEEQLNRRMVTRAVKQALTEAVPAGGLGDVDLASLPELKAVVEAVQAHAVVLLRRGCAGDQPS